MEHKEAYELLTAYLDDEMTVEQRRDIEAHMAGCQLCQREIAALKTAQDALRQALRSKAEDVSPPDQAWTQLLPELEGQRPSLLFLFRRRKWRIIATIIILAIIVALAVLWGTGILPGIR